MRKSLRLGLIIVIILLIIGAFFRIFCGMFIIQPIGAVPDGTTIIYWRSGTNLPFIASADGLLEESGAGVSLLGRAIVLGKMADTLKDREWFRIKYYKSLYLISTNGKQYEK